jgi:hypothetical protein
MRRSSIVAYPRRARSNCQSRRGGEEADRRVAALSVSRLVDGASHAIGVVHRLDDLVLCDLSRDSSARQRFPA